MVSSNDAAADALSLLEQRVHRIDYILHGDCDTAPRDAAVVSPAASTSATARLRRLERALTSITASSPPASEIVSLQKSHPWLFHPTPPSAALPDLFPTTLAQLVLAHSDIYTAVSAHLTQLNSQSPVPDAEAFTKLIQLGPRIEKVGEKQAHQVRELAELRERSARAVEMWYSVGVLGMGDKWADWEERVRDVEIQVRRKEVTRKKEEGII